jgi:predicted O-methyltransferase YrrM
MSIAASIMKVLPLSVNTSYQIMKGRNELRAIAPIPCDASHLLSRADLPLGTVLASASAAQTWTEAGALLDPFDIPDGTGGVNPGDRRAIHYLIERLKPGTVLEIGTHIGASTVHIAAALQLCRLRHGKPARLVSVDIADVNSVEKKPWLEFGTRYSPLEMIERLGFGGIVEFVTAPSLVYAETCEDTFDFIFLDGSHAAAVVYQEIPMAMKLLKPGGIILLHDYFPDLRALWSNGGVIPGPFMATERLAREGAPISVLPLGKLPWLTKLGSNVTSLALLLRN